MFLLWVQVFLFCQIGQLSFQGTLRFSYETTQQVHDTPIKQVLDD